MTSWSGSAYQRVAAPQTSWGRAVLDRLTLPARAVVVDAGCGSGAVTRELLERWPDCQVIAVDASASMLATARHQLADHRERIRFVQADVSDTIDWAESVDAVFSTGTLHWVLDHDALFAEFRRVLKPGGQFVAQAGGHGSLAALRPMLENVGIDLGAFNNYATAEVTQTALFAAGFTEVTTWLGDETVSFDTEASLRAFLSGGALAPYFVACDGATLIDDIVAALPDCTLNFVRLNLSAR